MGMTHELAQLLARLFRPSEFAVEVLSPLEATPGGAGLRDALPSPEVMAPLLWFDEAARALHRRGLVHRERLFRAMLEARPEQTRQIQEVARQLDQPAPEGLLILEDEGGASLTLRCLSWRLYRPLRWRLDLPVFVLMERLRPAHLEPLQVPISWHVYARLEPQLAWRGQRLDPALSLEEQGLTDGEELEVWLDLLIDAPNQARQSVTLRGDEREEQELEGLLVALGFGLQL